MDPSALTETAITAPVTDADPVVGPFRELTRRVWRRRGHLTLIAGTDAANSWRQVAEFVLRDE